MRVRALFCLMFAALLALPACGGDDGGSAEDAVRDAIEDGEISAEEAADIAEEVDGASSDAAAGEGSCSVDVTGGYEKSWEDSFGIDSIGSDYWADEDQLEQAAEVLGAEEGGEDDFLLYGLVLNCDVGDGVGLSVLTTQAADKQTFPFAPGSYDVASGVLGGGDDDESVISTVLTVGNGDDVPLFRPVGGTFDITKFDDDGFEATLTMDLEDMFPAGDPRNATLQASFSYDCGGGACG